MRKDKIQSENSKKLPRFGALDALILLVAVIFIVGIFFRYSVLDILTGQQNLNKYNVSFTVDNIRYTTPNYVYIGDSVYFANDGKLLGTITNDAENRGALNAAPATEMFTDSNGNIVEVHYPNETRVSASGRLLCSGSISETGGILINGDTYIAPGQTVNVRTELVTMTIEITHIELAEQ